MLVRSALVWPPCECGQPVCPDLRPSGTDRADGADGAEGADGVKATAREAPE